MNFFSFFFFFLIFLEAALLALFLFLFLSPFMPYVGAGTGQNVTIDSQLEIGNAPPVVKSVDIEGGVVSLNANTTKLVNCSSVIEDYNGQDDVVNVTAEIFDNSASGKGQADDNNKHYTNNTCNISYGYGDENQVLATCLFDMWYYSNPGLWNCSIAIMDSANFSVNDSNATTVQTLLALEVPSTINYGVVNATAVSNENSTNVTNVGNVMFNLSFSGYGSSLNDNLAMNCTLGSTKNISAQHEKYNLTASNPGALTFAQADDIYRNLSSSAKINLFNLDYRTNDNTNDVSNETYWRIYVPLGVAGSCQGHVIFGAVQAQAN
jgi:hypothetical protein